MFVYSTRRSWQPRKSKMANKKICLTVHALLTTGMCLVAEGAPPIAYQVHSWNIPSEDGVKAVRDFGLQSGVPIGCEAGLLKGKRLNALSGTWSVDDALQHLLQGTGFRYIYNANGRAVSVIADPTPPVRKDQETAPQKQSLPVHAQPATSALLFEEIVVTAQKRPELLQDVPVSAQVIGSDELTQYNLRSFEEVASTVPSVHISNTGSGGQIFVRGVGSGSNSTFDQSVGVFLDDIYHGRAHTTGAIFLDLDHVEVLKGPQSTFFGNNAIAGALNVIAAKPSFGGIDGGVRALYGEFDQYTTEGFVNVPVGETFALRVAATADGTNGWQKNNFAGENQPHERNQAGRLSLRWRLNDDLDATLKLEGSNNVTHDGYAIADCPPPAPFVPGGFCKLALAQGLPTGIGTDANTTIRGGGIDLSTFEDVLTINYTLGDQVITAVTGYYKYDFAQRVDAAGVPFDQFNLALGEQYHQFSQELRFTSPAGRVLEYLGGLYFQTDHIDGQPSDLSYFFLSPTIQGNPRLAALTPYLPLGNTQEYTQEEHSYAAFGSLGWRITERLKVTGGIRGSWVYKNDSLASIYGKATQDFGGIVPLPANLQPLAGAVLGANNIATGSGSYDGYIPSAIVQYSIASPAMAYVRFDKGFLAGIPLEIASPGIPASSLKSEHVNSYEVGLKSQWLDRRLRLNFDVFRSDYRDLQVVSGVFNPQGALITVLSNAAQTRSQGIEWDGEWVAGRHFRITLNATYLDSKFVRYPNVSDTQLQTFCHARANLGNTGCIAAFGGNGDPGGLQDLSGKPTGFAPRWSGSLTGTFTADLPRAFHFTGDLSAYYSTWYYDANVGTDDPLLTQPGYVRLDARLSLEIPGRQWAFDVIGKNLTSRLITQAGTGATALPTSLGSLIVQEQAPRNVAAQVRYRF